MLPASSQEENSLKESKLVSGQSMQVINPIVKLHASSMQKLSMHKNMHLSNILVSSDKVTEQSDTNTASESVMSVFRSRTGFLDEEPVIIMVSEFIPIFQGANQISKTINTKEKAALITARNACFAFGKDPAVTAYLSAYKAELSTFVKEQQLPAILSRMSILYELLKVQNFISAGGRSFASLLERYGDDVKNYLPTKVWQQALLDLKFSFETYTVKLLAGSYPMIAPQTSKNDHLLSGINISLGTKLWININPVDRVGELEDLYPTTSEDPNFDIILEKSIIKLSSLHDKLYVDIGKTYDNGIFPSANSTINSYAGTGRDIALLSTILTKEFSYSGKILNRSSDLKNVYGYDTESAAPQSIFDFLIGKFTNSSLDVPLKPIGNGFSLSGLSYDIVPDVQNTSKLNIILALENSYLANSNLIPGAFYYIESSLQSKDGKTFDVARLNNFLQKIKYARESSKLLMQMISPANTGYLDERTASGGESRIQVLKNVNNDKIFSRDSSSAASYSSGGRQNLRMSRSPSPQNVMIKSSAQTLIGSIMDNMKDLQNIYLEMQTSKNYQPSRAVMSERIAASLLKLCVNFEDGNTSFKKEKVDRIRSIIFLYVLTGNIKNDYIGSIRIALLEKLYAETAIKDANSQQPAASSQSPANVEDISLTKVFKTISSLMLSLSSEHIFTSTNLTAYSKMDKVIYFMANFDMLLRIVAAMTPDNFISSKYVEPNEVVVF